MLLRLRITTAAQKHTKEEANVLPAARRPEPEGETLRLNQKRDQNQQSRSNLVPPRGGATPE